MSYVIRIQWTFWYHRMMDLWLQQGSGRWARDLFRSEWRYTRSPTSMKGLGRLLCKGTLERSLFGWLDRRCSCWRQLNGRQQGVTAGLKTGPAVSTFLARIGQVNGYKSSRQKWLREEWVEKWLRLKAPDGEVPTPTPGLLSQLQGSCWDFWPGQAQL